MIYRNQKKSLTNLKQCVKISGDDQDTDKKLFILFRFSLLGGKQK